MLSRLPSPCWPPLIRSDPTPRVGQMDELPGLRQAAEQSRRRPVPRTPTVAPRRSRAPRCRPHQARRLPRRHHRAGGDTHTRTTTRPAQARPQPPPLPPRSGRQTSLPPGVNRQRQPPQVAADFESCPTALNKIRMADCMSRDQVRKDGVEPGGCTDTSRNRASAPAFPDRFRARPLTYRFGSREICFHGYHGFSGPLCC